MIDFHISEYKALLMAFQELGYQGVTVSSFLSGAIKEPFVILRHDIDRRSHKALTISELETKTGMVSTYYFRIPNTFKPEIIHTIADMGHEIGYHYEVLSTTKGDSDRASSLFFKNLQLLREIYPIKTVCMHGAPLSRYDNRDFWNHHTYDEYNLLGEAYLSIRDVEYFSDTGRTWSHSNKTRDFLDPKQIRKSPDNINTTGDLIQYIEERKPPRLYLLTHPERWAESRIEWSVLYGMDQGVNLIKKCSSFFRR